jgi:hypothetical protein
LQLPPIVRKSNETVVLRAALREVPGCCAKNGIHQRDACEKAKNQQTCESAGKIQGKRQDKEGNIQLIYPVSPRQ